MKDKKKEDWKEVHNKSLEGIIKSFVDARSRVEKKELTDFWKEVHNKSLEGMTNKIEKGEE